MAFKYQDFFDSEYNANAGAFNSVVASAPSFSTNAATMAVLDGTLLMFEATRELRYLTRVLAWCETLVATCTILDTQGYKNWPGEWTNNGRTSPDQAIAYDLNTSARLDPMARCARLILTDAQLTALYGARAIAIRNFCTTQMTKMIVGWGQGPALDTVAANVDSDFDDRLGRLTYVMIQLVLTGDTQWQPRMTTWLNGFQNRMHVHALDADCLVWNDSPTFNHFGGGPTEDTGHANINIEMMVDAAEFGFVLPFNAIFGPSISAANLFTQRMWDGTISAPRFTNMIDGSNPTVFSNPPYSYGIIYPGFARFGKFHTVAQQASEAMLDCIITGASCVSASKQYNNTIFGRSSLAGILTANQAASLLTRRRELNSERGVTRGVAYVGD